MKLNLDKQLLGLDGEPKDVFLYRALAEILYSSSTMQPAQTMVWAYDLIKNAEIEVKRSDLDFISDVIVKSNFIDAVKDQIQKEIDKLRESEQ